MIKKIYYLCMVFLVVFSSLTFSQNSKIEITNDIDTLSESQSVIISNLNLLNKSKNDNDYKAIEEISKSYLLLTKAYIRDRENYNPNVLLDSEYLNTPTLKYKTKSDEYFSKILEVDKREIIWDKVKYNVSDVRLNNNDAFISIVEDYTYFVDDDFQTISRRVQEYYIYLHKTNLEWKITEVTSNSPEEESVGFEYYDFDVNQAINNTLLEREKYNSLESKDIEEINGVSIQTSNDFWSYSTSRAVAYAAQWYNGVNPVFGAASQDCQNFASQVIWAGLGGEIGSGAPHTTSYPVIYSSTYGSTMPRLWQHNNYVTTESGDATKGYGWHWDNVNGFFHLINTSSSTNIGPYGKIYYNLDYASIGDVIAYGATSNPISIGSLDHAMVVTNVTGSSGSRNPNNIFISAHNSQTSSAYQALIDYLNKSESHFATARIYGGYYPAAPY